MATDPTELRKLVKQLQGAADSEITGILNILKKDYVVNESVLRESKAGIAVGKLRSHKSKEVADLAKELVKKWKADVDKAKQAAGIPTKSNSASRKPSATPTPVTPTASIVNGSGPSSRNAKSDGVNVNVTGDKTRDKCIELTYDALAPDSNAPSAQILSRSVAIELALYKAHSGSTNAAYKAKIRQLYANLKDKNNVGLRDSVVSGALSVDRLCIMSSADMASEERKAADQKIKEENLFNSLGAGEQQAETDAFQCGRCKQRKCRYRQAQTRSADEPMTTFVTCVNCNNRWKFS